MTLEIEGRIPKRMGLTKAELKLAAKHFAFRSSARVGIPFQAIVIVLQDDAASATVHQAIMNVAGATDVITQGYTAIPPEPEGVYGELYVNCERALKAAPRRKGWSPAKELLLYIAHGMDHLSGADDYCPTDYARMRRRELGWMKDV